MDLNELLRSLQSMFSRVSKLEIEKRSRAYHTRSASSPGELGARLSDILDHIAVESRQQSPTESGSGHAADGDAAHVPAASIPSQAASTNLSEYLKSHPVSGDTFVGDKLMASTWSHIHTAILKAREGDAKLARLHADIASQAMNEAGHFLSEAEYSAFAEEISRALEQIRSGS